jgi:hypothetical protein
LIGAFMALPAAAVIQATVSTYLTRHDVVDTELTREDSGAEEQPNDEDPRPETDGILRRMGVKMRRNGT